MPSATTNPVPVDYDPLGTPADMGAALDKALDRDYRGQVEGIKDNLGAKVFHIELNGPDNGPPVSAYLGDFLVWDGAAYSALTADDFGAKYTPQ